MRTARTLGYSNRDPIDPMGISLTFQHDAAKASSERLLNGLNRLFRRWEIEHGFQEGAGQILLPAGYRP